MVLKYKDVLAAAAAAGADDGDGPDDDADTYDLFKKLHRMPGNLVVGRSTFLAMRPADIVTGQTWILRHRASTNASWDLVTDYQHYNPRFRSH